ncbi:MAG: hypothetical protein DRP87_05690 [Spirochaetes bacterium]|nr:MAG: hypothetical protein DRP87_05690 [Spirochaetota bacterium]
MSIFAIFALPLFFLSILSFLPREEISRDELWIKYFRGLIVVSPLVVVLLFLKRELPATFPHARIYLFHLFFDHALFFFFAIIGYFITFSIIFTSNSNHSTVGVLSYMSGFYTLISPAELLIYYGKYNIYILFLIPFLRIALILYVSVTAGKAFYVEGWGRYLLFLSVIIFPAITAAVSLLYRLNYILSAVSLTAFLVVGSVTLFYFLHFAFNRTMRNVRKA